MSAADLTDTALRQSARSAGARDALAHRLLFRLTGPVAFPLCIFLAARLVNAVMIVVASRHQIALNFDTIDDVFIFQPKPKDPGYQEVITNWDGQWYQFIASDGYQQPGQGPGSESTAWAWAFPPLYPLLVSAFMAVTGLGFPMAATLVSLLAGAVGHVLLYRYLRETAGVFTARAGVLLMSTFISAPLFQAAYSEGLALVAIMGVLLCVRRKAYWWALLPVTVLAFTRLVTPALAVVVVVHMVARVRAEGRGAIGAREILGAAMLAGWCLVSAFAWPTMASKLMGEHSFNRATSTASGIRFAWFTDLPQHFGPTAAILTPCLLLLLVRSSVDRRHTGWGLELRAWSVAYALLIFAVTPIGSGILRYALLAPTLGLVVVGRRDGSRRRDTAVVAVAAGIGVLCQWWYIDTALVISSTTPLMVV